MKGSWTILVLFSSSSWRPSSALSGPLKSRKQQLSTNTQQLSGIVTRPNTRRKMRLAVVWEKALRTEGPTDGRTDGRTDTPSYRDATAHLKTYVKFYKEFRQRKSIIRPNLGNPTSSNRRFHEAVPPKSCEKDRALLRLSKARTNPREAAATCSSSKSKPGNGKAYGKKIL